MRLRVAELEEVIADTYRLYHHLANDSDELFENDPTDDVRNYHRALDYRSCATLLKHRLASIAREDVLLQPSYYMRNMTKAETREMIKKQ